MSKQKLTPEMVEIFRKEAESGAGCLGGCCLMIVWLGFAMPFVYLFFKDFFRSIPLIGDYPIIGPIVIVAVFAKASQLFDNLHRRKYRRLLLENDAYVNVNVTAREEPIFTLHEVKGIPNSIKNLAIGIILAIFAINIYFIPFTVYHIFNPRALWAQIAYCQVKLVFAYLFGYMLSRNYLRSCPFRCDEYPKHGNSRFRYLFHTTVTLAFVTYLLCKSFGWLTIFPDMMIAYCIVTATVFKAHPGTILEGKRPYLLFLRRFHGFGDRSLIVSILKNLPQSLSIAFLVSPQNRLVSWDPLLTLLHGQKLGALFQSMPYYFISQNISWVDNVKRMMQHASGVIIDVSQISESIQTEIHLIRQYGNLRRTLFVSDSSKEGIREMLMKNGIDVSNPEINYLVVSKSWLRSIGRMILGLVLLAPAVTIISNMVIQIVVSWLIKEGDMRWFQDEKNINLATNLTSVPIILLLFSIFFLKPSLSKHSEMEIRRFIDNAESL